MIRFTRNRRAIAALVVTLTAVPAVALAATDAAPGDPLKLGQDNHILNATTTLSGVGQNSDGLLQLRRDTGSGIGAVLKVVNSGPGVARRGIDINVPTGQPPITVSPGAGKASGLDADRLDGKDRIDFMSSGVYGNGTRTLKRGKGNGSTVLITALDGLECDEGDIALSAGGNAVDPEDHLNSIEPFRSSYQIEFTDNGGPSNFRANIVCIDQGAPHQG